MGSSLRLSRTSWGQSMAISVSRNPVFSRDFTKSEFRLDCQNDLSKSITKLNEKSKLFLLREAPQTLLPKLWKEWNITHLVFEKDTDAYARERDEAVKK